MNATAARKVRSHRWIESMCYVTEPEEGVSVRWLADLCGLPPIEQAPQLASKLLAHGDWNSSAAEHVSWWIRHPNPGSLFEKAATPLLSLPDNELITALRDLQYDGLLYQEGGEVVGHVFFQRHDSDLCAFSAWVGEQFRTSKLWAIISLDFIAIASDLTGIRRARVGAGNSPITRHTLALLDPHAERLGWQISADGWINFLHRNE